MRSKVVAAEMATAAGIPAAIVNGLRHEALGAVLAGATDEGTHFPARALGISSFKLWLRYAKPAAGTIVIDAGAARALRDGGTSLLPVGVVDVVGDFAGGDAVRSRPPAMPRSWARASSRSRRASFVGCRACSRRRCARCCHGRRRKRCIGTTSYWPEARSRPVGTVLARHLRRIGTSDTDA